MVTLMIIIKAHSGMLTKYQKITYAKFSAIFLTTFFVLTLKTVSSSGVCTH